MAVLGPGGVGGFLAAALTRAGNMVTVIARPPTASAIATGGIAVRSAVLGDFIARPATKSTLDEPVETLFIATKATDLAAALERITSEPELVVPLLNGIEHLGPLRARFGGARVPAATIRVESDRPAPGQVVQSSPFVRIDLAAADAELTRRLPAVAAVLEAAGLTVRVGSSEAHVMWSKLVRLGALASTTAAADLPLGEIRDDPDWRARLLACADEGSAVANAEGAELNSGSVIDELMRAPGSLTTSMQRDLAAGRTPELDAIQGAVLRAAARHGISCPATAELTRLIAARAGIPAPVAG